MRWRGRPLSVRTRLTLWYTAVLFATLVVISGLSYWFLRHNLMVDLDESLLAAAQVISDTTLASEASARADPERLLREILGSDFYDKVFRLLDPHGNPGLRPSPSRGAEALPLSLEARANVERRRRRIDAAVRTRHRAG